jgi:hypothetical protein
VAKTTERQAEAASLVAYRGVLHREAIYRLDELKERMGWRDAAYRAARRKGLKVYRVGKRTYVSGEDLFAYITMGGPHE